jgi:hypothetical protein
MMMDGFGVGLIVVIIVLALAELALVIWALIDVIQRPHPYGLPKWLWVVLILCFNFFGPVFYLLIGRREDQVVDDWRTQTAGQRYVAPQPYEAAGSAPGGVPPVGAGTTPVMPAPGAAPAAPTVPADGPGSGSAEPAEDAAGDEAAGEEDVPAAPDAPEVPEAPEPGRSRTERAIDSLYGPEKPAG